MDDLALGLGGMTSEQTEKVLQFQDLTGIEDVTVCRDVLQRHSWDLEVAVQDQLNIREGRPSMFATNARAPAVVNDHRAQQYFFNRPRDDYGGGIIGIFRYLCHFVFNLFYNTIASTLGLAFRLFRPDPRKSLTNPLGDVLSFISSYEEQYGTVHPVFYQGTYAQAVNDAKQELRFLLIYLHCESNTDSVNFCRDILSNPDVVSYINQHMLFWACSVNTGEGYKVSQTLRESNYPVAVIVLREGRMTVVARMEITVDAIELVRRLRMVIKDNEICLIAARAERMERSFNQTLRAQQDEAYQQSLLADQEKERQRVAERKRLEEMESMRKRLQAEEDQRKEEIRRMKVEYVDRIPQEPAITDPESVQLVIKLPCGARLERRFLKTHSLRDVYNYVFCHPSSPDSFEIATNFPKRSLQCTSQNGEPVKTLEEAGIKRGEVLFVYDLEA
ncbi:UNVERIFIED_CONTAM: hypothetical protein PYX00_003230 [Menopon gallinae]|uniref:UBX domain-containing protein n=1 Tax=Menopon gallinae TaxID=328185 RepID=A0AAW2I0I1_9NEOP